MSYLFVYGILKPVNKENAVWPDYELNATMYDTGHGFPAVSKLKTGRLTVGDIIEVDDRALAEYDMIEGVPTHYKREIIEVEFLGPVYIYIYQLDTTGMIPISEFHGLNYVDEYEITDEGLITADM